MTWDEWRLTLAKEATSHGGTCMSSPCHRGKSASEDAGSSGKLLQLKNIQFYKSALCDVTKSMNTSSSNWRLGAKLGLENERQLLEENQKLCRARTRKFSLETNRRRKALEEKQKQREEQEQRQRQNILQQRRHRVQDATERFQRGHLPASQRYRQSFRKNVPTIEEALNQIQARGFCSNSNSRICTPSPKPPTIYQASHHQALSAVEAHSKLLQEQSAASVKSAEWTQQKEQDHHSPQVIRLSNTCDSESLSSLKDSLECRNPTLRTKDLCSDPFFPPDFEKSHLSLSKQNFVDPSSFYAKMILNYLPQSRLLEQQKQQDTEGENNMIHESKASIMLHEESGASMNNLNKILNSEPTRKPVMTASLQHTGMSNVESDTVKSLKPPEEEAQKMPAPVGTSPSLRKVKFLKGILKKPSKFMSEDVSCSCRSGRSIFAKEVAVAIKDSVELTRVKINDAKCGGTVKKKLRWFDEVQMEKEEQTQELRRQMEDMSSGDHQLSHATVSGGCRPAQRPTPAASTGYHFTKLAWADVGVQVSLQQERGEEVKVPWSSTSAGVPKVPRREHVSLLARKGAVIRPQSATEVSQIAKTQGKFIAPRPPPRMEEKRAYITRTPYGTDYSSVNCKQAQTAEQTLHKDDPEGPFSPYQHPAIRTDSNVVYTALPPSFTCPVSEGSVKGTGPSSGHADAQCCSGRRGTVHSETGLCLNSTPTDEEISLLWHGVRSALTSADEKNKPRRQSQENGQALRKPCVEPSRRPLDSWNSRFPQPSQPTEPYRRTPSTYSSSYLAEGPSATHSHLAKAHAEGLLPETDSMAGNGTGATLKHRTVPEHRQRPTNVSLEEQKILLSLDRLNQRLLCVNLGKDSGSRGLALMDRRSTKWK